VWHLTMNIEMQMLNNRATCEHSFLEGHTITDFEGLIIIWTLA
jgi:hypothetical protein